MANRFRNLSFASHVIPAAFFLFLGLCIVGGGSSRAEVQAQPLIWLASIGVISAALWVKPLSAFKEAWVVASFVGLIAILTTAHLIPLPPSIWTILPGRELYRQAAELAGIAQPWRPLSLTPDFTITSLLFLLPVIAAVAGYHALETAMRKRVLPVFVVAALASAVLGLMQITIGPGTALYYYDVTNNFSAVGIFANRNHHAAFLSAALPMLAVWARLTSKDSGVAVLRNWFALGSALFVTMIIITTGSRAGLGLAVVGIVLAVLLFQSGQAREQRTAAIVSLRLWQKVIVIIAGVLLISTTAFLFRTEAVERLFASSNAEEIRFQMITPLVKMTLAFFPFGSGFGSFEPVYRAFEPFELLSGTYMNHAHNDLLHIIIEGGLPAAILLLAYLLWWAARSKALWTKTAKISSARLMGRLGSAVTAIMLLASLGDYPLRMPVLSVLFIIATLWMLPSPEPKPVRSPGEDN